YLGWRMPGIDGLEAARQIRALGLHSAPMLLMVTAHGGDDVRRDAGQAGISQVLVKPVSTAQLHDVTAAALGQRPAEQYATEAPRATDAMPAMMASLRG